MEIDRVEQRDGEVVYWIKSDEGRDFGIVFPGTSNVVSDEIVEGIKFSSNMFADDLNTLKGA